MSEGPQEPSTAPEALAPLGGPAEAEPPVHTVDPGTGSGTGSGTGLDTDADTPLEDSTAYELAAEDGAALAASGDDPGAGPLAPEFREPGAP